MLSINATVKGSILELDIHGMTVQQAKKEVQSVLKSCPKAIREIDVIHGYNGGNALQQYVRSIKHPKVERVIIGMNSGKTTLILK
jgi:DNA-nicking Smr family endonuclease